MELVVLSSDPSSVCQASWASTRAVTRLLGMMGRPSESRGRAMKAGRSCRLKGGAPDRAVERVRSVWVETIATIWPKET
jgi:hypothetical protein